MKCCNKLLSPNDEEKDSVTVEPLLTGGLTSKPFLPPLGTRGGGRGPTVGGFLWVCLVLVVSEVGVAWEYLL